MMMGGVIVILDNAGESLGEFMMDGEIYIAGKIASLGDEAVPIELRDGDEQKVPESLTEINKITTDRREHQRFERVAFDF